MSTLRMRSWHSVDRRSTVLREDVFNVETRLWARDNPHDIRERVSVSVSTGIVGGVIVDPYLLPNRLTAPWYRDSLETLLSGLLEVVSLSVRQKLWFQRNGTPSQYVEDIRQ
jgi:hypothetical protein